MIEPCWSFVRALRSLTQGRRTGKEGGRKVLSTSVSSRVGGFFYLVAVLALAGCGPSGPGNEPDRSSAEARIEAGGDTAALPREGTYRERPIKQVRSQTLYVPTYSHIHIRDAGRTMNLTTTLSVRNASPTDSITLEAVNYYDSDGNRVEAYLDTERALAPLSSTSFVVEESDTRGGVGANFIVQWQADDFVHPPVVETVMITAQSTQGISFVSTARVLSEDRGDGGQSAPSDTL